MQTKNMAPVNPQLPETLGQTVSAGSTSVVIASDYTLPLTLNNDTGAGATTANTLRTVIVTDQTSIPAAQSGAWTVTVSASALPVGAATEATLAAQSAKLPATLGQKAKAASLAVALASDQDALPITDNGGSLTVDGTVAATQSGAWTTAITAVSLPLPTGAATETTVAAINTKTPALGQTTKSGSVPVTIASDQGNVNTTVSNLPTTVALNAGIASASTLRTVIATDQAALPVTQSGTWSIDIASNYNRAKVGLYTYDHTVAVTTSAYTQVVSSTAAAIKRLHIFDSSGSALYVAIGAAASEVDQFFIPPGGIDQIDFYIPSGSRISIKAVDTATSSGKLLITALS